MLYSDKSKLRMGQSAFSEIQRIPYEDLSRCYAECIDMARWLVPLSLLVIGVYALYNTVGHTVFYMGGKRVPTWVGKTHGIVLGVVSIIAALAFALAGFKVLDFAR